jgi:hypothetical protein
MRCAVEGASCHTVYTPRFVTIGSGSWLMLKLLSQQFERLQYWYNGGRDMCNTLLR